MAHATVIDGCDSSTAKFQSKQLALVEHLLIMPIAPPMEPVSLIATENFLIRYKTWNECCPPFSYGVILGEVLSVWFFEESSSMFVAAVRIVIFDGKHAMPRRTGMEARICVDMSAVLAFAPVPPRRTVFL